VYRLTPILALALGVTSCLPGDTRPPPERVEVTVQPGAAFAGGIETADGWRVTFDRFLLGIGNIDFENDDKSCNSYAEARYDRLYDFTAIEGPHKVGTVYGLGTCRVEFRLRAPSFDVLRGPGVTQGDVDLMRVQATDRFSEDGRVSLLVIGAASRGQETKRFEWAFRRSYELTDCEGEDGGFLTTLKLSEAGEGSLPIEVRPEQLFLAAPEETAELHFQPIADADADADGAVTLLELSEAPPPPTMVVWPVNPIDGGSLAPTSLEALVYQLLVPRVLRVAGGGACLSDERGNGR
jgi:hypothetical protein